MDVDRRSSFSDFQRTRKIGDLKLREHFVLNVEVSHSNTYRGDMSRKMLMVDDTTQLLELPKEKLEREFGLDLNTIPKARRWLTNPQNWFESQTFILRWDGLVPYICRRHGLRLLQEPWDDGIPEVVVREQMRLRSGGRKDEPLEAVEGE